MKFRHLLEYNIRDIFSKRLWRKWGWETNLNLFCWCQQFCAKNQRFLTKIVPLLKAIALELCYKIFSSVFSFCKIKGYWKFTFFRLCIRNQAFGLLQIGRKLEKWQWYHKFPTCRYRQFFWRHLVILVLLVLSSTAPSLISITSLVLEVWQFLFVRNWPKIRKSEIPPSEFCSKYGDCGEQGITS